MTNFKEKMGFNKSKDEEKFTKKQLVAAVVSASLVTMYLVKKGSKADKNALNRAFKAGYFEACDDMINNLQEYLGHNK